MPFSYSSYVGNGSNRDFAVPYPFLLRAHVRVLIEYEPATGTFASELLPGPGFAWINDTLIRTTVAPITAQRISVVRQTPSQARLVTWNPGSQRQADDLNTADLQLLYVTQEAVDRTEANSSLAAQALGTANAALVAISAAVVYPQIANLAAVPGSPTLNQRIEILNSTGVEGDSRFIGVPGGYVGNSQLAVRAVWTGTKWQWVNYLVLDPDGRYLPLITTAQNAANAAQTTANTANTAAGNANTAAGNAQSTANSAQTTANTGVTNAATAQGTANTANTTANNALTIGTAARNAGDNRNLIHNGSFEINEIRGTALATPTGANPTLANRWRGDNIAGSLMGMQTFETGGPTTQLNQFMRISSTVADASIVAGDFYSFYQVIEGKNMRPLAWGTASPRQATLSFWVRSSVTGTYAVSFQDSLKSRSYVASFSIAVANTWEIKTIILTGATTGTWNYLNGRGLQIRWCLAAGTTFQGGLGTWNSADHRGFSGISNFFAATGRTFDITGVQFEEGAVATTFETQPIARLVQECMRYYYIVPGIFFNGNSNGAGGTESTLILYPTQMRAAPVATWPSPTSSSNLAAFNVDAVTDKSARAIITSTGAGNFSADFAAPAGLTFEVDYDS